MESETGEMEEWVGGWLVGGRGEKVVFIETLGAGSLLVQLGES